jgi:hypothetical protein
MARPRAVIRRILLNRHDAGRTVLERAMRATRTWTTPAAVLAIAGAAAWSAVVHAQGKGPVASVTAGYQMTVGGQLRSIEFTAQRDAANNSRGEGQLFNHVTGTKLHFVIDCLQVVGTAATVTGTITHTDSDAFPEGTALWVQVVDNGEGKKSPPDLVSPLFAVFGPAPSCTQQLAPANIAIEGGNIQVH